MCGAKRAFFGLFVVFFSLLAAVLFHGSAQAATGINQQLNFQGKVVNSSGNNIADGTYNMEFKIYQDGNSSGVGSTLMWTEDYLVSGSTGMPSTPGVAVSSGTFNVSLGSICALAGSTCGAKTNTGVDFNQDTLWLSFEVGNTSSCTVTSSTTSFHTACGGDGAMTPFIRLTAVPQAMNSNKVGNLTAAQLVQLTPAGGTQSGAIDVSGNIKSGGQVQANTLDAATSGALTVGSANATSIVLAKNTTMASGLTLTIQGNNAVTLGSTTNAGGIIYQDGTANNRTVTVSSPALTNSYTLAYATTGATGSQCLQSTSGSTTTVTALQWGSCGGGGTTLQSAYTAGSTITTPTSGSASDLIVTLSDSSGTDSNFVVNTVTNSTSLVKFQYNSTNVLQVDPLNDRVAVGSNGVTQTAILSVAGNSGNAFSIMDGSNGALFNADTVAGFVINNGITSLNNDVSNPSFEGTVGSPYSGWNGSGVTTNTTDSRSGQRHYEITSASDVNSIKYYEVTPGDQVYFEGYMKSSAGATGSAGFFIQWFDYNKASVGFSNIFDTSYSTSYSAKTLSTTAPAGAVYARINMTYRSGATGTFYFDDIFFSSASFAGPMLYKNTANSTTAFQIQTTSGAALLTGDTTSQILTVGTAFATSASFSTQTALTSASNPTDIAAADFNADGKTDIVEGNDNGPNLSVFLNNTTALSTTTSFSSATNFTTLSRPYDVTTADINTDGKPDMITAENNASANNMLGVFLNTTTALASTPTFSARSDKQVSGNNPQAVVSADFNADGKPDVAAANNASGGTANGATVILNTTTSGAASPTWGNSTGLTTGTFPQGIASADFNGDGKPDLVTADLGANQVRVLLDTTANGGTTASFSNSNAGTTFTVGSSPYDVKTADINGDGKPDIIAADSGAGANVISVLINTTSNGASTPTFASDQQFATSIQPEAIASGDFNGDGKVDLVVSNLTGDNVSVLFNQTATSSSTAAFAAKTDYPAGDGAQDVVVADWNADSHPDFATANYNANNVSVFLDQFGAATNTLTVNGTTNVATIGAATNAGQLNVNGTALLKSIVNSSNAFQVENSAGLDILNVNTNTAFNLVSNPSFEANINGWSAKGAGAVSYDDTAGNALYGGSTLKMVNTAANDGAQFTVPLKASTTYSVSFWAKTASGSTTAILGRQENGSNVETSCASFNVTTTWTQFICTDFTTGATINGTPNIYIRQTVAGTPTIYIDGITLVQSSSGLTFDAGGSNFNVQSLSSTVTLNGSLPDDLQPWSLSSTAITTASRYASTANANGFVYYIGGCTGACGVGTQLTTVYYAKINADGSLSGWTAAANTLPTGRYGHTSFVANGYLYVTGGDTGAGAFGATPATTVYYSKLNGDGSVGTWQTDTNVLPAAREFHTSAVANGFAYAIGGDNAGAQSTVYYTKLYADGSTGVWNTTTALTTGAAARRDASTIIANGSLYVIGGDTGGAAQSTVYYNSINSDGTIGATWSSANAIGGGGGIARRYHTSAVINGNLYVIGGDSGSGAQNTIYSAKLLSGGPVGAWQTGANVLPASRYGASTTNVNGYIYVLGGYDGTNAAATPYYASGPRVLLGGTLDLVGLTGNALSDSSGAGAITAGTIRAIGDLRVDGYADFNNGISVDSAINLNAISANAGQTVFNINNLNSNSIFSIRHMSTNFGSLVKAGAFEGRNSYWGEEFNVGHTTACNTTAALSTGTVNAYARGDVGGSANSTVACASGATTTVNGGELNVADVIGTATIANNQCLISSQNAANGIERISAVIATSTALAKTACAENLAFNTTTSNKILSTTNLPVITAKVKMQAFTASAAGSVFVVGASTRDQPGTDVTGTALPNTGVFFTNCSGYTAGTGVPSGCSNTNWYGMVASGGNIVGSIQTCTGPGSLSGNFAYLRIEVRGTSDIHFFSDFNTSDGISEIECGTGVTSASSTSAMTPWLEAKAISATATLTNTLDIDYIRSWQDDNIPSPATEPQDSSTATTNQDATTTPPLTSDDPTTSEADQSSFFNFAAATSEDTVFNKDVYVKGTLYADKIKANQIEGLEVFTDKISSLQDQLAQEKAAADTAQPQPSTTPAPSSIPGLDMTGQVSFNDLNAVNLVALAQIESKGGLVVDKDAQFNGKTIFQLLADFNGDVNFSKQPTFNSDAGGTAVIKQGAQKVQVKFGTPYPQIPVVVANWAVDSDNPDDQVRLFADNYNYFVTKVDQNGFWIYLNKPATEDLKLNWLATSVKDAKISTSEPIPTPGLQ